MGLIFDLDQTLIDSSPAEPHRGKNWKIACSKIGQFTLYPGIIEAVQQFNQRGIKICIVTTSVSYYCEQVLDFWKLPYDFKVCYHDTDRRKPAPDPILKALDFLKYPAQKVLSFGDRDIDIIASNRANVLSVACMWGSADVVALKSARPTYSISSAEEMVRLVNQFWS
ncbi:HAD family hydrolase [Chitinophaga sp. CF418]|uniref:HAD family hydrolase n=1 Tax=Chitinophaga sp. CF418 TaxID=1855287 RepID=UPI0009204BFC|nr:NIF family HAD-type phosphatase [Chitinophaga sp. CF418]SHN45413.1 Haloacid dehalogenase-like hydrolase [Chitinophaga sp. CF418]